jgi:hypothetical protein
MTRRNRLASFGSTRADEDGGPEEEPLPEGRRLGSGVATTQEDSIVAASKPIQAFATSWAPIAGIALPSVPERPRGKVSNLIM